MDLKTYAVFRKLNKNSDLLKYVVNQQAVPLDVLNKDMQDLLDNLHDADAECVVNDYQKYLQEQVQMNFVPDGKNQFNVNGEVAEPLMESIELLHHVDRKDVVHDLVANVMDNLRGERDVKVEHIKLAASAKAFVASTKQPVFSASEADTAQQIDEAVITPEDAQTAPEAQPDLETQVPVEQPSGQPVETAKQDVKEALVTDPNIEYLKASLPEGDIQPEAPLFEEPEDVVPKGVPADVSDLPDDLPEQPVEDTAKAAETAEPQDNPFKKAYDFLVDELKNRKIDDRLPGLHLA